MTELELFQDLAVFMVAAGLVAAVCAKFKFPKIIGYIIAGLIMNAHTWGGAFIMNESTLYTAGILGVVFLMFATGLDFSISQIRRVKAVALPIAIFDTLVMTWVGYTIGNRLLGWGQVPSLFLGVAICDSATTMLAKMIDELKWGNRQFVKFALAGSVCEDIICVSLIAIIVGVAGGGGIVLSAAASSIGGLIMFCIAVSIFGFIFVPRLMKSIAKHHDDESIVLSVLGCCFVVVWAASKANYPTAIGAFIIGVVLSTCDIKVKIAMLVGPLKIVFSAIFFVSIGLLINPEACFDNMWAIVLLTIVVIAFKFLNCSLMTLLSGESLKTSVQTGMALAQIGEFAFMVAVLYYSQTKDVKTPIFSVVAAVSIITTMINPVLIKCSEGFGNYLEAHLPRKLLTGIETYDAFMVKLRSDDSQGKPHAIITNGIYKIATIVILNLGASIAFSVAANVDWSGFSKVFNSHKLLVFALISKLVTVALIFPAITIARQVGKEIANILTGGGTGRWEQAMVATCESLAAASAVALTIIVMVMGDFNLMPHEPWARWTVRIIVVASLAFGWRFFVRTSQRAAERLEEALGADERRERLRKSLETNTEESLLRFTVESNSPIIGLNVVTLNIRAKTGASVIAVEREGKTYHNIGAWLEFAANDVIVVSGNGANIAAVKDLLAITNA